MKKVLLALAALAAVVLAGGIGFVLFFMEDGASEPVLVEGPPAEPMAEGQIAAVIEGDTDADILDALDYATTENQDTVAWLVVPNTRINNSVVQGFDNYIYLRANEQREYSIYGCYFADAECNVYSREVLSHNTVVYGHSDLQDNPEGPRFSELFKFADPDFARITPTVQLSTLRSFMYWEVFAVFYTTVDFDYIYAEPEGGIKQLADEAKRLSIYDYGVDVGDDDHILTLSTCSVRDGDDGSHRFVVMAKLLPEGAERPRTADVKEKTPGEPPESQEEQSGAPEVEELFSPE